MSTKNWRDIPIGVRAAVELGNMDRGAMRILYHSIREVEAFYSININSSGGVINVCRVAIGDANKIPNVNWNTIVTECRKYGGVAVVLAHNHPTATGRPSPDDYKLTSEFSKLSIASSIQILDHIIVSADNYYSLRLSRYFDIVHSSANVTPMNAIKSDSGIVFSYLLGEPLEADYIPSTEELFRDSAWIGRDTTPRDQPFTIPVSSPVVPTPVVPTPVVPTPVVAAQTQIDDDPLGDAWLYRTDLNDEELRIWDGEPDYSKMEMPKEPSTCVKIKRFFGYF